MSALRADARSDVSEGAGPGVPATPGAAGGRPGLGPDAAPSDWARDKRGTGAIGNAVFASLVRVAALLILATLAAVAAFLLAKAWPAIADPALTFRTMGSAEKVSIWRLIVPQVFGTVLASALAMVVAVPVSVGIALFISHFAPRRLQGVLGWAVDLLAAVPSVIYGLWGAIWLVPLLTPVWAWLSEHAGWFPLFAGPASPTGRVLASASLVLAVMVVPIITSVSREVFLRTPHLDEEAALALGATRWEMIRMAVLPFGRSGVVSASMLGLGRALGETMAVVMVLSVGSSLSWSVVQAGQHSTIAANIALQFPESTGIDTSALVATGLALFAITLVVNSLARRIVSSSGRPRGRSWWARLGGALRPASKEVN